MHCSCFCVSFFVTLCIAYINLFYLSVNFVRRLGEKVVKQGIERLNYYYYYYHCLINFIIMFLLSFNKYLSDELQNIECHKNFLTNIGIFCLFYLLIFQSG